MAKQFTLGKEERLKSRKAIEQLFSAGQRFSQSPLLVWYQWQSPADKTASLLQCGVGVSSRNFKKATDRNRLKRLTREAYRLEKLPLQAFVAEQKKQLHVFIVYTAKEMSSFEEIKTQMGKALEKLIKRAGAS